MKIHTISTLLAFLIAPLSLGAQNANSADASSGEYDAVSTSEIKTPTIDENGNAVFPKYTDEKKSTAWRYGESFLCEGGEKFMVLRPPKHHKEQADHKTCESIDEAVYHKESNSRWKRLEIPAVPGFEIKEAVVDKTPEHFFLELVYVEIPCQYKSRTGKSPKTGLFAKVSGQAPKEEWVKYNVWSGKVTDRRRY